MTDDGDGRFSDKAQDLDDHLRDLASDLGPYDVRKKPPRWSSDLTAWLRLLAIVGFSFAVLLTVLLVARSSDSGTADAASPTDPAGTASSAATSMFDMSDEDVLSGTWAMYWTNDNGSASQAFTIRFDEDDRGTIEIVNDDTEFDTTFWFDGNWVWFTFTRIFDVQGVAWPEISILEGTFVGADEISGGWRREDWECLPDRDPPCKYLPDAVGDPSRLVRES